MTGILMSFPSLEPHARLGAPGRQYALTVLEVLELEEALRTLCAVTGHIYKAIESPSLGRVRFCVVCGAHHHF